MSWAVPEHFRVRVGGNIYIDCPILVSFKGESIFKLSRSENDGFLAIDFDVYGRDGSKLATVRNGQFLGRTPAGYQVEGSADAWALREVVSGRAICELRIRSMAGENAELDVSAQMYLPDGRLLAFSPAETNLGAAVVSGCTFKACDAAISIE